jgi:hypothetical protein
MRALLVVLTAAALWPDVVLAQEPTPTPAFSIDASLITGRLWKPGQDRQAYVGARTDVRLELPASFALTGRAEATTSQDGAAAEAVEISNPATFQNLEVTVGAWRPVLGPLGPRVSYGISVPMEAGRPLLESHPQRLFVGGELRLPALELALGGGIDQASGLGFKVRTDGRVHVDGRTSVGWNVSVGGADPILASTFVVVSVGGR